MMINPYSIGPFITGFLILCLGIYVYSKDPKNPLNRTFLISLIPVSIWLLMFSFLYYAKEHSLFIEMCYRIAYCAISLISVIFFTFIAHLLNLKNIKYWIILNYCYGLISCIFILKTPYIISGLHHYFFGFYPKAGNFHPIFLSYFFLLVIAEIVFLSIYYRKESLTYKKNQIKCMLLAFSVITLATGDFLQNYGIEIYPIGFLFTFIFILLIAYGIFRHNLLAIKTIISNSIVYSLLIAVVLLFYSVIVLILERTMQSYFGYNSLSLSIICAFMIGIFIIPLRNAIQNFIDTSVLKGSPVQISEENALLRQELTNADKLRSVAILASSLAHEIKNPVTTINTFADYLPSKHTDPDFLNKCRNTLLSETSRIQNLLSQLLSFAKPSAPVFLSINPTSILDEVLLLLEHKCHKANIILTRAYSCKAEIMADPNQLKQALINLLFNAIEAMPHDGTLEVKTACDEETYTISIKDSGVGIKPEALTKIFEPFYTSKSNGVGLGLAITQEIIAHHHGRITVQSTVNAGTEFCVLLPRNTKGGSHAA